MKTIAWVHRRLKEERAILIRSRSLEATTFEIQGIRIAYVFSGNALSINAMWHRGVQKGAQSDSRSRA